MSSSALSLDSAPLYKIPLLIALAWFTSKTTTPPNPPASAEEQNRFMTKLGKTGLTGRISRPAVRKVFQTVSYSLLIGEAVLIAAVAFGFSPRFPALFAPTTRDIALQDLHPSVFFYIGAVMACSGASIRMICFRHMGRLYTFQMSVKNDHKLVTDGPYGIVRHPGYIGSTLFYSGISLSMCTPGSWAWESGLWSTGLGWVFATLYIGYCVNSFTSLLARVPKEDKVLEQEFGEQWRTWTKKTPYRVVPFVY